MTGKSLAMVRDSNHGTSKWRKHPRFKLSSETLTRALRGTVAGRPSGLTPPVGEQRFSLAYGVHTSKGQVTESVQALRGTLAPCLAWLKKAAQSASWLILPVVICLSQRLSHACLSTSLYTVKLRTAH